MPNIISASERSDFGEAPDLDASRSGTRTNSIKFRSASFSERTSFLAFLPPADKDAIAKQLDLNGEGEMEAEDKGVTLQPRPRLTIDVPCPDNEIDGLDDDHKSRISFHSPRPDLNLSSEVGRLSLRTRRHSAQVLVPPEELPTAQSIRLSPVRGSNVIQSILQSNTLRRGKAILVDSGRSIVK